MLWATAKGQYVEQAPLPKCDCREIDSLRVISDSLGEIRNKYFALRMNTIGIKWPKELQDAADLARYRWKEAFKELVAAKGCTWKYSKHWDGIDCVERTCINECEKHYP